MVRVSSTAVNPLTAPGAMIVGGGGSVTGFARELVNPADPGRTFYTNAAGVHGGTTAHAIADDNEGTGEQQGTGGGAGFIYGLDFGEVARIGRYRVLQAGALGQRATAYELVSGDSKSGPWTVRDAQAIDRAVGDHTHDPASAASARYWGLRITAGAENGSWFVLELQMWSVTTVGAGNQVELDPPASTRALIYDVGMASPTWKAPGAANADTAAGVGVDVAAAGPAQVALLSEHNALVTEVNELKALLRSFGILAN